MLQSVKIRNFQSLKDLTLELGPLTVVVGDSSSGKTALIRALRMLVHNERGSWFVTNGETTSLVSASDNDTAVTLEKGVNCSGEYRVFKELEEGPTEKTFTKLAGSVPTEVSEALGIFPNGPHFAFQFDPPFLLKESGSAVAVTLGSLTGVSRIFEAVREANRRRLAATSLIKTRNGDLEQVESRLQQFGDLGSRRTSLEHAEASYQGFVHLRKRSFYLKELLESLTGAKRSLSEVVVPTLPDFSELEDLSRRRVQLRGLLAEIESAMRENSAASSRKLTAQKEQGLAETAYHEELRKAGRCPTCLQAITPVA